MATFYYKNDYAWKAVTGIQVECAGVRHLFIHNMAGRYYVRDIMTGCKIYGCGTEGTFQQALDGAKMNLSGARDRRYIYASIMYALDDGNISPFFRDGIAFDSEEVFTCSECGGEILGGYQAALIIEDRFYCAGCDPREVCSKCENTIPTGYENYFDDSVYCGQCIERVSFQCYNCSERVSTDERQNTVHGTSICESCAECYVCCEACGGLVHEDNARYRSDASYCPDCVPRSIKNYSDNVLDYCEMDSGKRLFGVELEMASTDDIDHIADATDSLVSGDAILKDDGSIATGGYQGFEVVTRPMRFENQIAFWTRFISNCDSSLRSYDVGTCGLHIHVTRKSISQLTLGKLLVFVNSPANKPLIKRIAQRYSCGYSKAKTKTFTDATKYNSERYEFINLQNKATIEFRIFKGTLNLQRLLACIEFTAALIEFCSVSSMRDMSSEAFTAYVARQGKNRNLKLLLAIQESDSLENGISVVDSRFTRRVNPAQV